MLVDNTINEIKEASKTPINRAEAIDILKKYSGDEFENSHDVWELAKKTESELHGELQSLLMFYRQEQKQANKFNQKDIHFFDGNDADFEIWKHNKTNELFKVPIEIIRDFENIEPYNTKA